VAFSCRISAGNWTSRRTASGSHMFPIPTKLSGAAAWTAAIRLQLTFPPVLAACPTVSDATQIPMWVSSRPALRTYLILYPGWCARGMLAESHVQLDADLSPDGKKSPSANPDTGASISIIDLPLIRSLLSLVRRIFLAHAGRPTGRYLAALNLDSTKLLLFDFKTQKWSTWIADGRGGLSQLVARWKLPLLRQHLHQPSDVRRVKIGQTRSNFWSI